VRNRDPHLQCKFLVNLVCLPITSSFNPLLDKELENSVVILGKRLWDMAFRRFRFVVSNWMELEGVVGLRWRRRKRRLGRWESCSR
jgi:hypothetical protein